MKDWDELGQTDEERIDKDKESTTEYEVLASILSKLRDLQQVRRDMRANNIDDQSLYALCDEVAKLSDDIKGRCQSIMTQACYELYKASLTTLQGYTDMKVGDTIWTEAIDPEKPLEVFMKMCAESIMQVKPDLVESAKCACEQAWRSKVGNDAQANSHRPLFRRNVR